MTGMEDGAQDCDNEPNHQHQFPRKRDNERADGHDANGGEKPTKKPDYSSREQEVDAKAYQYQKQGSKHFYSPLSNLMVLCVV